MSELSALMDAAKTGDESRVRELLRSDPSLAGARTESGESPLMAALYRGQRAVVEAVLDAGAPVDVFAAAALGRTDDLKAALEDRAALDSVSYDGWTPLHLASFFGHREAAEIILNAGARVSPISTNSLKNTPLHAATAGGRSDLARLLIERGADVTVPDAGGHTPLHIAAENGLVDVVKALLARGADPLAVDAEEKTPLSRAAARNHNDIIDAINTASSAQ
jgi:ankyrin repeat protein